MSEDKPAGAGEGKHAVSPPGNRPAAEHKADLPKPESVNKEQPPLQPPPTILETKTDHKENPAMEVHHHGHVHHDKKWKEYLFQFFMLFLAVFCGFFAEYQLEHIIEHNREKQFMVSLVKDLELDTLQLNSIKDTRLRNMKRIDSSIVYFTSKTGNAIPTQQYNNMQLGLRSFYQNSGTLDQLKNAGGLRLIRKRNIVDSIEAYDQQIKRMILRDQFETEAIVENTRIMQKMIDGTTVARLFSDTTFFHKQTPAVASPISIKTEYISEYLNSLLMCRSNYNGNLNLQKSIKNKAANLVQLIKKEYEVE